MWLTAFETPDAFPPTELYLLQRVTIGERHDHAWAHRAHAIPLGYQDYEDIIVGSRHHGFDIWSPTTWPLHIYICTVPEIPPRPRRVLGRRGHHCSLGIASRDAGESTERSLLVRISRSAPTRYSAFGAIACHRRSARPVAISCRGLWRADAPRGSGRPRPGLRP